MYPMCIFNYSYIQKHVDLEPNNLLMLLFLKVFEPRNKWIKGLGDGPFDCTHASLIDADFTIISINTDLPFLKS